VWLWDNQFDGRFVQQASSLAQIISPQPVCPLSTPPHSSANAYAAVLQNAGAFPRDSFDLRIIAEVKTRTGRIKRVAGPMPLLAGGVTYPDRDADGMSDAWEAESGNNIDVADSWADANGDGLSNLEAFLDYAHRRKMAGQPVL
jgi:pectate lyase